MIYYVRYSRCGVLYGGYKTKKEAARDATELGLIDFEIKKQDKK